MGPMHETGVNRCMYAASAHPCALVYAACTLTRLVSVRLPHPSASHILLQRPTHACALPALPAADGQRVGFSHSAKTLVAMQARKLSLQPLPGTLWPVCCWTAVQAGRQAGAHADETAACWAVPPPAATPPASSTQTLQHLLLVSLGLIKRRTG